MSYVEIIGVLIAVGIFVGVVEYRIDAKKKKRWERPRQQQRSGDCEESPWKKPSYMQKPVMTSTERRLYYALAAAVDGEFLLFAQVQLTGFMRPTEGDSDYAGLNKIHRKSVDFLLCDRNGNAVVAIELQDWTHNRTDRQKADAVKADALKSAGVPLIEFHAANLPSIAEISEKLRRFKTSEEIPTLKQG